MHLVKPLQLIALVVGRNLMTVTQAIVIGVLLSTAPSTRVQGPSVFRKRDMRPTAQAEPELHPVRDLGRLRFREPGGHRPEMERVQHQG